jgi:Protein of unknown function (DUF2829)
MNFEQALEALKKGEAVRRQGWDRRVYLFLFDKSYAAFPTHLKSGEPVAAAICTRTAKGVIELGYTASQTDLLAQDWEVVDAVYTHRLYEELVPRPHTDSPVSLMD